MACGILFSQPGIEPLSLAVKALSPNHWPQRTFYFDFIIKKKKIITVSFGIGLSSMKPWADYVNFLSDQNVPLLCADSICH